MLEILAKTNKDVGVTIGKSTLILIGWRKDKTAGVIKARRQ